MPLSEFYRTSKGKVEGSQQKNSTGRAVVPNNGLVELVCENGHIMMQDQSSSRKIPKIPTSNNLLFQTPRFLDKDIVDQTPYKVGKYGTIDSIYSDVTMSAPSGETGPSQEDDMANWFNYPIEDTLQQDYGSDFLPELSGVTVNESAIQNSFASVEKRDRYNQVVRDSSNGSVNNNDLSSGQGSASKLPSSRYAPLYPWSLQESNSVSSVGSRVSDIMSTNTNNMQHNVSGNLISSEATVDHFSQMNMQKQDSLLPRTSSSLLNFSHFSRPAAIARATIQNASVVSATVSSGADRIVENDKVLPASCRNPAETTQLETNCVLRKETNYHTQPYMMSTKVDLKQVEIVSPEEHIGKSDAVSRQDASNNEKSPNQDCGGNNAAVGVTENEKAADPVGASSSVCSGNSTERASNDPRTNLKRKNCRDTEESEGQSEDVEEESVGVKKAATARGGSGSKRSRAAEVHNLSERRRRDRINEKMRALQELIPNCNKVDKASMLDEAIEYLKTLQLQVQILSMGAGLYMPPMMLPPGMQHIHAAHLPHFSPMGVGMGMGMGMGYGMNMLDMHGGPRGCSMIPVSPMQGHFPSQPMSRSPGFHGMTGANLQVFGHPSQGIPLSVAGGSMAPVSGPPPVNSSIGMDTLRMGINMEAPNAVQAPNLDPKNLPESTNLRDMHSADASISLKHQSNQFHATNQECGQSDLVLKTDQGPDVGGSANDNSIKKNNTSPSREVAVVDSQS